jgi:hypothetical protein
MSVAKKITKGLLKSLIEMKANGEKISMLTALYDGKDSRYGRN